MFPALRFYWDGSGEPVEHVQAGFSRRFYQQATNDRAGEENIS